MENKINKASLNDPLAFFKYFYDYRDFYEARGFTLYHQDFNPSEDFRKNTPDEIFYDADKELLIYTVEHGTQYEDDNFGFVLCGAYCYKVFFVEQLQYKLRIEYWEAVKLIDDRILSCVDWPEKVSFLEDVIGRIQYLQSLVVNYTEASKYIENKTVLLSIRKHIERKHLKFIPKRFLEASTEMMVLRNKMELDKGIAPAPKEEEDGYQALNLRDNIVDYIFPFKDEFNNEGEYKKTLDVLQDFFEGKNLIIQKPIFIKNGNKTALAKHLGQLYQGEVNEPINKKYLQFIKSVFTIYSNENIDKNPITENSLYKYLTAKK